MLLSSLSICPSGETIAKLSYRAGAVFKFHHNREEETKETQRRVQGERESVCTLSYQPIPLPRLHRSIRNGRSSSPYERRGGGGDERRGFDPLSFRGGAFIRPHAAACPCPTLISSRWSGRAKTVCLTLLPVRAPLVSRRG